MPETVSSLRIEVTPARGWQRVVQHLAATALAGWFLSRWLPTLDRYILRRTKGQQTAASFLTGLPIVTVTTFGAKSGRPRECPLIPLPDGEKIILIASNFGNTRHPAWYLNLRTHPEAILTLNHQQAFYTAREATDPERPLYWARAVKLYPGYQLYEHRARGRKIPILILTPKQKEPL
ncbi:MAG: nitroreductase family deazaflavin-dependent oxidoreductase [Anaerolineales bacterium]|nr:nitroreductase family deazaflavin-dependent oxidoreductase [Anaerolineales bacterium]